MLFPLFPQNLMIPLVSTSTAIPRKDAGYNSSFFKNASEGINAHRQICIGLPHASIYTVIEIK